MARYENDLISNPTPRCACILLLDTSVSMLEPQERPAIESLKDGVRHFIDEIQNDDFARCAVDLGIVTFGGAVRTILPLGTTEFIRSVDLEPSGNTPMGRAVEAALDMLEQRKASYRESGVSFYQPWIVLISDGVPTDNWSGAALRMKHLANQRKLVTIGVGVGNCDLHILSQFCGSHSPAASLESIEFRKFFQWLSQSMIRVSQSIPGCEVSLPHKGWEACI